MLVAMLAVVATFLLPHMKNRKSALSPPPYKLSKKSLNSLKSMSKEIFTHSPLIWYYDDNRLLWRQERSYGGVDEQMVTEQHAEFVRKNMVPLSMNARLPPGKLVQKDVPLQARVREFLNYDYVIAIGNKNDVTTVVPCIPKRIDDTFIYVDLHEFTQKRNILLSAPSTHQHSLREAANPHLDRNQTPHRERLALEIREGLKIPVEHFKASPSVSRGSLKPAITYCWFQIAHMKDKIAEFCNGAPLDRNEMLYALRIILEWARRLNCISSNDKQANFFCGCKNGATFMTRWRRLHKTIRACKQFIVSSIVLRTNCATCKKDKLSGH
ncbi:hypothetical protein GCK32_012603 [Trichostrongylus colubriformis]|uniref:Uncharacterized protein n=1 Tax=Trichostrongylus colubriformis TaxID=6319 RepID=A0AAN8F0D9_TRICO